jgi:hypothetical protein
MQVFGCDVTIERAIFLAAAMDGLGTDRQNKEFSLQSLWDFHIFTFLSL